MLTALAGWIVVLIPPGGNIRFNRVFWLLALPLIVWIWGMESPAAWALKTVWLALLLTPSLALGALFTARTLDQVNMLDDSAPFLDTPTAMLVMLSLLTAFAAASAAALRRSSLPGGTRPATYLPPGTLPPGVRPLPRGARVMLMQGSLPFSGALINGLFVATVASLDPLGPAGTIWPGALQAAVVLMVGVSVLRGGFRWLVTRRMPHGTSGAAGFSAWSGPLPRSRRCGPGRRCLARNSRSARSRCRWPWPPYGVAGSPCVHCPMSSPRWTPIRPTNVISTDQGGNGTNVYTRNHRPDLCASTKLTFRRGR